MFLARGHKGNNVPLRRQIVDEGRWLSIDVAGRYRDRMFGGRDKRADINILVDRDSYDSVSMVGWTSRSEFMGGIEQANESRQMGRLFARMNCAASGLDPDLFMGYAS